MSLRTENLTRCIKTLEASLAQLSRHPQDSVEYEVFRNAVVKGFELTLETTGNLLRKAIKEYVASSRFVDELSYKDVIRRAVKHSLLDSDAAVRWFKYRDNRNSTAHDYGKGFAEDTLSLMPSFLQDARAVEKTLREKLGHASA
jgi:hypothetical protein